MNIETFKNANIYFDYCPDSAVPEIPRVQDVLFAMRLSEQQENYLFCVTNHATYVVNVHLVATSIGYKVLCMERYDEAEAKKIIAEMIISLCPNEARCLFETAFVEAKIIAGEKVPNLAEMDWMDQKKACPCAKCIRSVLYSVGQDRGSAY